MAATTPRLAAKVALVHFLLLFGCRGEDVVVKVDKYAKVPAAGCDAAITNLEVGVATGIVLIRRPHRN